MKMNLEGNFSTQKRTEEQERKNSDIEEKEGEGTLEKIGNSLIEIGKKLKEHPGVEKMKTIIKELGKDMKMLFGLMKNDEEVEEKAKKGGREERGEKESIMEKIRKSLQPYIIWGTIMISGYSILKSSTEKVGKKYNINENTIKLRPHEKTKEKKLIIDGPITNPTKEEIKQRYGIDTYTLWLDGSEEDFDDFFSRIGENEEALNDIITSKGALDLPEEIKNLGTVQMMENPLKYHEAIIAIVRAVYDKLVERSNKETIHFKYYNKELFKDYDSFKKIIEEDETFRKSIVGKYERNKKMHDPSLSMSYEEFEEYVTPFIRSDHELLHSEELTNKEKQDLKKMVEENNGKEIAEILANNKDWGDVEKLLKEKKLLKQLLDRKMEPVIKEAFSEIQETMKQYDEAIKKRIEMMSRPKYAERLAKEINNEENRENLLKALHDEYIVIHSDQFPKIPQKIQQDLKKRLEEKYGKEVTEMLYQDRGWKEIEEIIKEKDLLTPIFDKDAKELQQKMIDNIKDGNYYLSNHHNLTSDTSTGHSSWDGYIVSGFNRPKETIIHEESHRADRNGRMIPDGGVKILKENYSFKERQTEWERKYEEEYIKRHGREYFSNPTEILARKAVFDMMLEELGIKRYEEEFTEKHYKMIEKLYKEGKLDHNASEFFRMFEKDALIMIMNTVAYQDAMEKGVPIEQGKVAEELVAKILKVDELNKKGDTYYPPEFWVNSDTEVG